MRYLQLVGVIGFMATSAAWAGDGTPAPQHPADRAPAATPSLPRVKQQLIQHQAEVKQLKKDVSKQESDSKQASARLQQQDRVITELRQQLQALEAKAPVDHP